MTTDIEKSGSERYGSTESVSKPEIPATPPNGGTRAWLVALGAFASTFCTFGYLNSFGVFQAYYQHHFLESYHRSQVSWIGSLQIFFLFLGGLFSGPLTDRYGIRAVFIPAWIILVFAVMMTSLASQYYEFMLAQGVLFGIGCGAIFTPTMSVLGQWFTTKRAWAMGVAISGSSIGGVVFPIVLNALLNEKASLGFGNSVRIVGYIMLALLLCATPCLREHAPHRKTNFFLVRAFRQWPYVFTIAGFFFCQIGLWTPLFYVTEYAHYRNVESSLAFYLIAILNATSFFGRTIPNFMADKTGRLNANFLATFVCAVLVFCWTGTTTATGLIIWSAFYGFFYGALVALITPCLAQASAQPRDIATYVGQGFALCSIGGLISGPINGALIRRWGYLHASMFSGVMLLIGSAFYLAAKLSTDRRLLAIV